MHNVDGWVWYTPSSIDAVLYCGCGLLWENRCGYTVQFDIIMIASRRKRRKCGHCNELLMLQTQSTILWRPDKFVGNIYWITTCSQIWWWDSMHCKHARIWRIIEYFFSAWLWWDCFTWWIDQFFRYGTYPVFSNYIYILITNVQVIAFPQTLLIAVQWSSGDEIRKISEAEF